MGRDIRLGVGEEVLKFDDMEVIVRGGMTVEEVRRAMRGVLADRVGAGEADAMVRLVWHHLKGWSASELFMHGGDEVSDYIADKINDVLVRVGKDEPIQYVLGEARFYGLDLTVRPGVLIPRPETEELVDLIVRENPQKDLRVLDLCTGSGAIAVALACALAFAEVTGVDVSKEALEVARENVRKLRVGVKVVEADVFRYMPVENAWNIIVSNPPYVDESERAGMEANVLEWEPELALFVPDEDPLKYYRRIAEIAVHALAPGGRLYLEINPRHVEALEMLMRESGAGNVRVVKDNSGKYRFMICEDFRGIGR